MKGTLAGLITDRCGIRAYCRACKRDEVRLDPVALSLKYGEDADLEQLRKRLRCQACGVRGDVFWMPSWPDVPMGLGHREPCKGGVW